MRHDASSSSALRLVHKIETRKTSLLQHKRRFGRSKCRGSNAAARMPRFECCHPKSARCFFADKTTIAALAQRRRRRVKARDARRAHPRAFLARASAHRQATPKARAPTDGGDDGGGGESSNPVFAALWRRRRVRKNKGDARRLSHQSAR